MVFLKASVIRDSERLAGATAEKYQYIRDEQIKMQDNGFLRMKNTSLPVLPELEYYDLVVPGETPAATKAGSQE